MSRAETKRGGDDLTRRIREWIVTGIHMGRLHDGIRLPSYRDWAEESGVDLRAVAAAYATLEEEGLVVVRGRSGVFLAEQERVDGGMLAETARWMAGVLREAWVRRIPLPDLAAFVRLCTAEREVRCTFVESTVDQMETFRRELRDDFGFHADAVHADRLHEEVPADPAKPHLLATTAFHAVEVREVAERIGAAFAVVRLNPAFTTALQRAASDGGLTVLCADARFGDRIRTIAGDPPGDRVRVVLADDPTTPRRVASATGRWLVSDAARAALPGIELPPSFPAEPMIAPESAGELAEILLRLNLSSG